MPHKPGTYLGGVRTVEDLRQRSRIDEITDCWHWTGCLVDGRLKVLYLNPFTGRHQCSTGAKAALVLAAAEAPPSRKTPAILRPGYRAYICCQSTDCVNRAHARARTPAEQGRLLAKAGTLKGNPKNIVCNTRSARARSKLDLEKARAIRAAEGVPQEDLAARYGVAQSAIWNVLRGKTWRESQLLPGASVFAQRV